MNTPIDDTDTDPQLELLSKDQQLKLLAYQLKILLIVVNSIVDETGVSRDSNINLSTEDDHPVGAITLGKLLNDCDESVVLILGKD